MKLKEIVLYKSNPAPQMSLQKRSLRLLAGFLALMVLCTILSRAADSLTVAQVKIEKPTSSPIQHTLEASGRVEANGQVPVVVPSGLRVKEVLAKAGVPVKAGEVLFTLDLTEVQEELRRKNLELQKQELTLQQGGRKVQAAQEKATRELERAKEDYQKALEDSQLAVDRAEGDKNSAKKDLKQYEDIYEGILENWDDEDFVSPNLDDEEKQIVQRYRDLKKEFRDKAQAYNDALNAQQDTIAKARRAMEDAQLTVDEAENAGDENQLTALEIEIEKLNMQKYQKIVANGGKVLAPEDGTVSSLAVTPGGLTGSEAAALLVLDEAGLTFVAEVSDDQLKYLSRSDKCEIEFTGGERQQNRDLSIDSIRAVAGKEKTSEIRVNLPAGQAEIGKSGQLTVRKKTKNYDMCLPISALRADGNQKYVLVVREKTTVLGTELVAERVDVTVQDQNENQVAVSGGLWRDDGVITSSSKTIQTGDRVRKGAQ